MTFDIHVVSLNSLSLLSYVMCFVCKYQDILLNILIISGYQLMGFFWKLCLNNCVPCKWWHSHILFPVSGSYLVLMLMHWPRPLIHEPISPIKPFLHTCMNPIGLWHIIYYIHLWTWFSNISLRTFGICSRVSIWVCWHCSWVKKYFFPNMKTIWDCSLVLFCFVAVDIRSYLSVSISLIVVGLFKLFIFVKSVLKSYIVLRMFSFLQNMKTIGT